MLSTLLLALTPAAANASATGEPQVSVSPNSLAFPAKGTGPLGVGVTSAPQKVTVTNTGTAPLLMGYGDQCGGGSNPCVEGSYQGDYSIPSDSCGYNTIPVGTSCTFTVTFTPSTTNQEVGSIDIFDNAASSPQTVALTGQGTAAQASVSPNSPAFPAKGTGPLGVGVTSAPQKVTVTNTGTVPLLMGYGDQCGGGSNPCLEGSYRGDYSIPSDSCSYNTIPVGTSCTFTVTFTPSTTNQEVGSIDIFDNAASSPQTVTLTGQGTAAQAKISPSSLSFFTKQVGTTSGAQTVTVTNTGTVPLLMGYGDQCGGGSNPCLESSYQGDYSIASNSCSYYTIPAGTSCAFTVTFTPSTTNQEVGSIDIFDSAASSPQTVALTGQATSATVSVSATSLAFPPSRAAPVGLGLTSPAQQVTVTNTGKVPVLMGYGSPTGADPSISSTYTKDFAITSNSCAGNTIPAGTTCTFSVEFTPSTLNQEVGTLTIYDNAIGSPQVISLTGQGTAAQGKLSASKLTFSSTGVGVASSPQKVTVSNTGTVPLQMGYEDPSKSNPTVTGSYSSDFTILSNSCADHTIPIAATCTFEVEFTPSTTNDEIGTLLIYGNTADNPQEIVLQGSIPSR